MDAEDGAYKAQDLTMKSMWQDASARFADRTGLSLDLKPPKTLDDCVGVIEKRQQPVMANSSFNTSSRTEKAKEFGIDIIRCLKLLGGVAAQGADMVGEPASLLVIIDGVFLLRWTRRCFLRRASVSTHSRCSWTFRRSFSRSTRQ